MNVPIEKLREMPLAELLRWALSVRGLSFPSRRQSWPLGGFARETISRPLLALTWGALLRAHSATLAARDVLRDALQLVSVRFAAAGLVPEVPVETLLAMATPPLLYEELCAEIHNLGYDLRTQVEVMQEIQTKLGLDVKHLKSAPREDFSNPEIYGDSATMQYFEALRLLIEQVPPEGTGVLVPVMLREPLREHRRALANCAVLAEEVNIALHQRLLDACDKHLDLMKSW